MEGGLLPIFNDVGHGVFQVVAGTEMEPQTCTVRTAHPGTGIKQNRGRHRNGFKGIFTPYKPSEPKWEPLELFHARTGIELNSGHPQSGKPRALTRHKNI